MSFQDWVHIETLSASNQNSNVPFLRIDKIYKDDSYLWSYFYFLTSNLHSKRGSRISSDSVGVKEVRNKIKSDLNKIKRSFDVFWDIKLILDPEERPTEAIARATIDAAMSPAFFGPSSLS